MNQNELRIRNLVTVNNPDNHPNLKGVILEVTSIHESGNREGYTHGVGLKHINQIQNRYYETYSQFVRFIEPIPLTEELLLKLGFELLNFDSYEFDGYKILALKCGKLQLTADSSNEYKTIEHKYLPIVLYVHQLQNLYFALTGVELQLSST